MRSTALCGAILFLASGALLATAQSPVPSQTLRVDLDLVLVPVSVTDADGRPVPGLRASDFRLWEDRIEQDIRYASAESMPASIGVILDVSNSMNGILPVAQEAVAAFLEAGHTEDEYFLIEFNDQPRLAEEFTHDVNLLRNRLIQAPPEGRTALYDALYRGVSLVQRGINPRKALLIVTDGEDNRSRYSRSNIEEYIRESSVQMYAIGISSSFGKGALRELTSTTGGRAVFADDDDDLEEITRQIAIEMKNQYVLGYVSTNQDRDGNWRELRVRVASDEQLSVRARRGYYASRY
jgi:Ca-activated chloride channel family protein